MKSIISDQTLFNSRSDGSSAHGFQMPRSVRLFILAIPFLLAACASPVETPAGEPPSAPATVGVEKTQTPAVRSPQPETPAPTETAPPPPTETPPQPLEWPEDVGWSHFGLLVGGPDPIDFEGAWVRPHPGPFIWGEIERVPGEYNWRRTDQLVSQAQSRRAAVLVTVWPFAEWDQESCHADQPHAKGAFPEFGDLLYMPCDMAAYLTWLGAMVERYDGDGLDDMPGLVYPLRHWEILNEPAMQSTELTFFQEGPAEYLELLKVSYAAVKEADPNAVVLPGGQAGMQRDFKDFWSAVISDAKGYFDLGNIHSISSADDFFAAEYRAWLDELGYAEMDYWITEALVGRMGPFGEPPLNDDELAQLTFTGYATAFGHGAQVIFNVGGHDPTGGPGKASQDTFVMLAQNLGDFAEAAMLAENAVRFDFGDGRSAYALWDGASLPAEVDGPVEVITYAGERSQVSPNDVITFLPVLVLVQP